ncbi:phosphoribosylformylglycinamidine synthase subunit PurL [Legionella sp. W05-934-2]|uniref:phosphoribosylformylglycinamidine synthase subunit PurL n=1 Tax=Legionella sp. W05-934-2 TaxID=1198649 RepID=UPI003462309A
MENELTVLDFSNKSLTEVKALLMENRITLAPEEALHIQNVILKRPPTLAECHLWNIQGSEHCSYKSSRIHLKQLPTDAPNVILGPKEDAGIVSVAEDNNGHRYGIVMSHESHNHPSQIVPFEGAATGVGGNIRDVCCMGAEVIALADGLRFGSLDNQTTHWISEGVVDGISSYGNATGIANIAGDVYFNAAYNDNCLVTVVTLGIVRDDQIIHSYVPENGEDYVYILVGKATDNSGFGGASFASANFDNQNKAANKGAVQEPNAFLKRHLLKANYALFEQLKNEQLTQRVGFKDLGAGGVACATVEMAEAGGYGADVMVEQIPVSMTDLPAHVVLCSETQERFMWAVPPNMVERILKHYNEDFALPEISKGACAAVVGKIRKDMQYVVTYHGQTIIDAKAADITKGIVYDRPMSQPTETLGEPALPTLNLDETLLTLLAHENIASRAPIYETYDKQVQGRTQIESGMADAGVMMPFNEDKYPEEIRHTGIALSLDHNPRYNQIDPYWGAVNAVVESARNIVATGATPAAISDCLCFGNPENPERMWTFAQSIKGITDACQAIGLKDYPGAPLPVISGNVSLYNESERGSIPPSPMIGCLGRLADGRKAVASSFRQIGSHLLMVGARKAELGGSVLYELYHALGASVPKPDLSQIANELNAVTDAIDNQWVLSAHDIGEGGIAVAIAEMSFAHQIGVDVTITSDLPDWLALFGESGGFVLEIEEAHLKAVVDLFSQRNVPCWLIGQTNNRGVLSMQKQLNVPVALAKQHWENGLREKWV